MLGRTVVTANLDTLDLRSNRIGHAGVAELCAIVIAARAGGAHPLRRLDLSGVELTDDDADAVARLIEAGAVVGFGLAYNRFRCTGATRIAAAIGHPASQLRSLNLRCNLLKRRGVEALVTALALAPGLAALDIRDRVGFGVLECKFPDDPAVQRRLLGFPVGDSRDSVATRPARRRRSGFRNPYPGP